jgi:hypothetical protein
MGIRDLNRRRRGLSLDSLEGFTSPSPKSGDTSLVTKCLRLRKVPIGDFAAGDLRLMIGQREGLMYLIPLAIEQLRADPMIDASYYPGDLLCAVLRAGREFWQCHVEHRASVEEILARLDDVPGEVAEAVSDFRGATS